MRDIPNDVIASWPVPNYTNPVTRGPSLVIFNAVLISVVTFTVLLRIYVRAYMLRWLGVDDLFIVFALVSSKLALFAIDRKLTHTKPDSNNGPYSFSHVGESAVRMG
jgi:hypothetical protein